METSSRTGLLAGICIRPYGTKQLNCFHPWKFLPAILCGLTDSDNFVNRTSDYESGHKYNEQVRTEPN